MKKIVVAVPCKFRFVNVTGKKSVKGQYGIHIMDDRLSNSKLNLREVLDPGCIAVERSTEIHT